MWRNKHTKLGLILISWGLCVLYYVLYVVYFLSTQEALRVVDIVILESVFLIDCIRVLIQCLSSQKSDSLSPRKFSCYCSPGNPLHQTDGCHPSVFHFFNKFFCVLHLIINFSKRGIISQSLSKFWNSQFSADSSWFYIWNYFPTKSATKRNS